MTWASPPASSEMKPQVLVHQFRVDARGHQRRTVARHGIDRPEDVAPLVGRLPDGLGAAPVTPHTVVLVPCWAEPHLVLEPQFNSVSRVLVFHLLDKKGALSSHALMALGSFLG